MKWLLKAHAPFPWLLFLKFTNMVFLLLFSAAPPHLYPPFLHTNSLIKLSFCSETLSTPFSSERIITCLFNIKPSEDQIKPLISFIS